MLDPLLGDKKASNDLKKFSRVFKSFEKISKLFKKLSSTVFLRLLA